MTTFDEATDAAARAWARVLIKQSKQTPREQAEAAWTRSSPYTVDELEDRIRARRGLEPLDRTKGDAPASSRHRPVKDRRA